MGYYDDEKTALKYIRMAEGYDGRELVRTLRAHLPAGARVLELGMGPGKDLRLLGKHYRVTGSDLSRFFVELYRDEHPDTDLLVLDAVTMNTARRFDCIYSNKVLHHFDDEALAASLAAQHGRLRDGGLLCHSFWRGSHSAEIEGLYFHYRNRDELRRFVAGHYEVLHLQPYTEMDRDDSLLLIARKLTRPNAA